MYKGAVHASGVGVGQGGGSLLSRVSNVLTPPDQGLGHSSQGWYPE